MAKAGPTNSCAGCGEKATLRCSGCLGGLDIEGKPVEPMSYCKKECQVAHRKNHKESCRLAIQCRQLYRGAELAQQIFYLFREIAFDVRLNQVTHEGERLRLSTTRYNPPPGYPLYDFPNHLFENDDDKHAVLSWLSCNEALCWLHPFLQKVLKGITTSPMTELRHHVRRSKECVYDVDEKGYTDPTHWHHFVVTATLTGENKFAIDLTGAQHRQYRAVMPLAEYMSTYPDKAESPLVTNDFGYCNEKWREMNPVGSNGAVTEFSFSIVLWDRMATVIEDFERDGGRTITELLNLSESAFESEQLKLLEAVKQRTIELVERLKKDQKKRDPRKDPRLSR